MYIWIKQKQHDLKTTFQNPIDSAYTVWGSLFIQFREPLARDRYSFIGPFYNLTNLQTMKNLMKTTFAALIALVLLSSCERVAPNYIGVFMQNYGKEGKSDFSIVKGRVNTMSPGTELFLVPSWKQRATFEQPISLQASDQTSFNAKPNYAYTVIQNRAVDVVFQNKQLGSGDTFMKELEDNVLETDIYDIMKEESRKYLTDTLMARGGSLKFEKRVESFVNEAFEKKGLKLENFTIQLEFSKTVTEKIDNRNEVNTNISVIDQKINEQRKKNELVRLQAEENIIRSTGLTKEILKLEELNKWNGVYPTNWNGSNSPSVIVGK